MRELVKHLAILSPSHCVCDAEIGSRRTDVIRAGALMAELTGMEIHIPFNGETITCVPSLDRPPAILESLRAYIRGN